MICSKETKEVQSFAAGFQKFYTDYMKSSFPTLTVHELQMSEGKRYIKFTRDGSVRAFIDKENGDVLKAASWKAPAKGARGNVFAIDNGLTRVTPYGMEYNKPY